MKILNPEIQKAALLSVALYENRNAPKPKVLGDAMNTAYTELLESLQKFKEDW